MSQVQLLELDVTADPGVLLRVVSLCHKRGITIASLRYDSAPEPGRILLGVHGDAAAAGRAGLWLGAIVPVLAVRSDGTAPSPDPVRVRVIARTLPPGRAGRVVDLLGLRARRPAARSPRSRRAGSSGTTG